MYQLKFNEKTCASCKSADCLLKCQYMTFAGHKEAHGEMMKIMKGKDSRVLNECVTCYACEEYCQKGNHPFYLISEKREEKGMFTAPRPITTQWINMTRMQGKYLAGDVKDKALSCCYIPDLGPLGTGEIFKDVASAGVFGAEFMCPAVHTHFARMSVIKERLPVVIENYRKLGVKEVICLHDECYGTLTSIAQAYGMEVPFKPVYYMDYLYERMKQLKAKIKPLNITVAYQRPCSNRLIPDKLPLVKKIFKLIGVKAPKRTYQDENALCCAEILRSVSGYKLADDVLKRNIDDMLKVDAEYCVFNCPACQTSMSERVAKRGLKPVHLIDLCKMAIGEKEKGDDMSNILQSLIDIVGEKGVSNAPEELWFYSRDPGVLAAHKPDYVVAPRTTEEVQKIVQLAGRENIPVVPMGNGMSLAGLVIPLKGGIVLDMKRMNKILEVNAMARYAVLEGGTSQGALKAYLQKNHPTLRHSLPDAPPTTTIAANVSLHGQGRLTNQYGFNSDMVTGLEVVLPTGEICRIGSPSIGPYWFSKGPTLPDMSGLFLGWLGSTGIITKVGLKLFPNKKIREVELFVTDRVDLVPVILYKLTHLEMLEDVNVWFQPKPQMFLGNFHITLYFTGDTEEEIEFKRKMIWDTLQEFMDSKDGGFMSVQYMKEALLQMPGRNIADFADVPKGGGFEYSGPITIIEHFPQYAAKVVELAQKYNVLYASSARLISGGHSMMFSISFAFNRNDPAMMTRVKQALDEATAFALEMGGIPWKPNFMEQKMVMEKMEPNALKLLQMIKKNLDPCGIMNPGNWEVNA